jgi:hypothetical protein
MSPIFRGTKVNRRRRPLACAGSAVLAVAVLAGCGTASHDSTTATKAASAPRSISTSTGAVPARTSTTSASAASGPLAFAKCMRANGVTDFPDPKSGEGFGFNVPNGVSSSPTFRSAMSECQKLLPTSGPLGNGAPPSKRTMAKLLRIARCIRAHGVQFPDPLYSRPAHISPGEYQEITDFDGAFLLFPTSMNLQAPAYRQALTACGSPPLGLPH